VSVNNSRLTYSIVSGRVLCPGLRKYRGRVSFRPLDVYRPQTTQHSGATAAEPQVETNHQSPASPNDANVGEGLAECANLRTSDGPVRTDLPPLSSAVPPDWVTVEDDFVLVIAVSISHIAQDLIVAPSSSLDDGVIYLAMIRAPISRLHVLKLFLAMQDGSADGDPGVEVVRVGAFRLEPLGPRLGTLMVDGEMVDYGPIQAQVLPSMARVMTLDKVN